MRRLVVTIVFLALAAPAAAQNGQIVASSGGYDLYARHGKNGRVCLSLLGPQDYDASTECEYVDSPFHPLRTLNYDDDAPLALAVPGTVGRVTAGGRSADAAIAKGFDARFVLLAGAGRDALLHLYDDNGALIGASDQPGGEDELDGKLVFRDRGARLRVRRSVQLEPTPLQYDRTVPQSCIAVSSGNNSSGSCTLDRDLGFEVHVSDGCAPTPGVLYGLLAPRVRSVEAVLGSGRRLRARTVALKAGPARLLAVSIPRGEAVRRVRGLAAGGSSAGRRRLGVAPTGLPCAEESGGFGIDYLSFDSSDAGPIADPVTVAEAGGRALRVADGPGVTLCSGFAKLSCFLPPVDTYYQGLDRRGRVLSGVLAGDVATVDLQLAGGGRLSVSTTDGGAYTGRYAGRVRFLAAEVPSGTLVRRAIARAADGRRLGELFVGATQGSQTRRRVKPGLELVRSSFTSEGKSYKYSCLQPRRPQGPEVVFGLCSSLPDFGTLTYVSVSCTPRRSTFFGTLNRRARSVRVVLDDGRVLRPRVRRFDRLGRVWTAVLPAGTGVKALRYRGRLGRRGFRVLPAARQCGYDDSLEAYPS